MKAKKFNKKLGLNKSTVVNLNNSDLRKVYGGNVTELQETRCATGCILCPTEKISRCITC